MLQQANNHHVVVEPHKALGKDVGKAKPLVERIMIQWVWNENTCEIAKLGKHDEMTNVWKPWRPERCACTQPLVPWRSIARSDEKYIAEKCAGYTIHKCRIQTASKKRNVAMAIMPLLLYYFPSLNSPREGLPGARGGRWECRWWRAWGSRGLGRCRLRVLPSSQNSSWRQTNSS